MPTKDDKYFTLGDRPNYDDLRRWFPDMATEEARRMVPWSETMDIRPSRVMAVISGEFREPKADEWYLSGAIVQAYRATNDLTTKFHIAKIVLLQAVTTLSVVRELSGRKP